MSTISPAGQNSPNRPTDERTLLGHPVGLFLLFLVEMWERFSYYGMRALLVLYLISVTAIHQLTPGVHNNDLRFVEMSKINGGEPKESYSSIRQYQIVVGGTAAPAPAGQPAASNGTSRLVIQRLRGEPNPAKPDELVWEPDTSDTGAPIVLKGPPGGTPDRDTRGFDNVETRFRVTNPGDEPVDFKAEISRPNAESRTYFTLNDNTGTLVATIKPTKSLAADEKPFEVVVRANTHDSGRNWLQSNASVLYGWYTGLAYLFPILGGLIADKLIGTHRSMLVGGILISIGHVILGISGVGALSQNQFGMSLFFMGLAVIVLGTGHFKPTVSVMVGQLYSQNDPRRDGAFTIFYMGINLGAFLCAFVCGTLGESVGWHWGFASAAGGMILGLLLYLIGRPKYLAGIGEAASPKAGALSFASFVFCLAAAAGFAALYHFGGLKALGETVDNIKQNPTLTWGLLIGFSVVLLGWVGWFVATNPPEDRGPVVTIFVFMLFNAFFWVAFEQAGSSLNVFTQQNTNRMLGTFEVKATWFQSVNAGLIFILAPVFAGIWTWLGKRNSNPSQPVKISLGLIFLGIGYLFMVVAGRDVALNGAKASMFFILATYFWHTVGELCLSPTGLSYVTRAAPAKFVSLLMGIWFISSFIANLGGGLIASQVEAIEQGQITLPWKFGGQADFYALFVVFSIGPGLLILILSPLLKKLMRPGT